MKLRWKKPIKINRFISERGSSSVLVIMVMLLLITFGVLAMMSSYSNLKIARKHAEWTRDYYQLTSLADSDLKAFERFFERAIDDTEAHFVNQTFDPTTIADMPDVLKETVIENANAITPDDAKSMNSFADQLFLYHLYDTYMREPLFNSSNYDYDVFTRNAESEWIPEITFITQDAATNRQLFVKIAIDTHSDSVAANTFSIIEWREVPKEFEYNETIDFEDPEGN